jgi:hypothetical protein
MEKSKIQRILLVNLITNGSSNHVEIGIKDAIESNIGLTLTELIENGLIKVINHYYSWTPNEERVLSLNDYFTHKEEFTEVESEELVDVYKNYFIIRSEILFTLDDYSTDSIINIFRNFNLGLSLIDVTNEIVNESTHLCEKFKLSNDEIFEFKFNILDSNDILDKISKCGVNKLSTIDWEILRLKS